MGFPFPINEGTRQSAGYIVTISTKAKKRQILDQARTEVLEPIRKS